MKKIKKNKKTKRPVANRTQHRKGGLLFSGFAKKVSDLVGSPYAFILALCFIIAWLITGPIFNYSDTWQLIINTATTIITFLMVFLIQHTQNRDTEILNLKLDELILKHKKASNTTIDLAKLSDEELQELEEKYKKICNKRNNISFK